MKLANRAYVITLILLMLVFAVPAQQKSDKDDRNTAPTVGTGGPVGGPTGLFTVYDSQTLRKGEYTISAAYSNYDRDPGNVDITTVPVSFQIGATNNLELFFSTEVYRGIKVNAFRNLSGFYLPNIGVPIGGVLTSAPAIVLAPQGPGVSAYRNSAVFRPQGAPFSAFPYTGGNAGTYGLTFPFFSGNAFGFNNNANATLGPPRTGGSADLFPGVGSVYGSLLPGIVLTTQNLFSPNGTPSGTGPRSFTTAPTYIADAPFIGRRYGTSSLSNYVFGFKLRLNDTKSAWGHGITAFYRWYPDHADSAAGFNQLQRGASSGANKGDIGLAYFADARVTEWANVSGNIGYVYTSKVKGTFGGTQFTILDQPDELHLSVGADFPINRFFQPILEFRSLRYVGGRTPNSLEQHPYDALGGIRIFPRRWFGFGAAYRININQQDDGSFGSDTGTSAIFLPCQPASSGCSPVTVSRTFTGVPEGLETSRDPHGFIGQVWIGRRDKRAGEIVNQAASVTSVSLSDSVISLPCRPGFRSRSGACNDSSTVSVQTTASDPENDVLTYNYTVSGGRIVGQGAKVDWDLSGAQPGTYTITTGVDDGCGVCGKTDTRTVKVEECPDCVQVCTCPDLTVSGPSGITSPGSPMTFTASTSGDVTYSWTVSAGTISSGQGTPSITVDTTGLSNQNVTATVDIGGREAECNCTITASATGDVAGVPTASIVDEFGAKTDDEIKANVDNFFIQLNNNPSARGFIINYGSAAEIKKRRAQIMKAINFRKYDVSRVTFVDGPDNGSGVNTKFYLVPAGATDPTP
ncbi:MAG: hypothetical protein ABIO36_04095 [Pyrinomonadaceae bacterium]